MWTKRHATQAGTSCGKGPAAGRPAGAGWWRRGLQLMLLAAAAAACDPVGNITLDLPATSTGSTAYYVDTLTVRVATVLHDSIATSTTDNLLVGRYHDPRLGTITARSFVRVGLGAAYAPATAEVFDSLVLVLKPDKYRYGDTTRLQTVEVHRLRDPFVTAKTYYAFSQLGYDAAVLNQGTGTRALRVRPRLTTLRLRLADALGQELLTAGKAHRLETEEQLYNQLAGLAITPGAADDAALFRSQVSTAGAALSLYTHLPFDPLTAIAKDFTLAAGAKHFYQIATDGTGTLLAPLTTSLQALDVSRTAQESYIDGALGLQTKIEIPYLNNLRAFGSSITIVQAQLVLEALPGSTTRYLPPPGSLVPYLAGRGNQQGLAVGAVAVPYLNSVSTITGLETGSYSFAITAYCQAVVDRALDNDGVLLASAAPTSPERVVLGGPRRSENRLRLELYFLSH